MKIKDIYNDSFFVYNGDVYYKTEDGSSFRDLKFGDVYRLEDFQQDVDVCPIKTGHKLLDYWTNRQRWIEELDENAKKSPSVIPPN